MSVHNARRNGPSGAPFNLSLHGAYPSRYQDVSGYGVAEIRGSLIPDGGGVMRPSDVRNIIQFNTRMGMFICPSNRSNVESFLHGYEYGTAGACGFTQALGQHLAERYHVHPEAFGWAYQIARLAESRSLDWMELYLLISPEVLNAAIEQTAADTGPRADADSSRRLGF